MRRALVPAAVVALALSCGGRAPRLGPPQPPAHTFAELGAQAIDALARDLDAGGGRWWSCDGGCDAGNADWGDDALTRIVWLRWSRTHDPALARWLAALASTAADYGPCTGAGCTWSDVAAWDAVAELREHEATGDPRTLALARHAYARATDAAYLGGRCPSVMYQHPRGDGDPLKTLETLATALDAAILLARATGEPRYRDEAIAAYAAARAWFLDPDWHLYTVYVVDSGVACEAIPRRFFASVNGEMIWAGVALAHDTGDARYRADAVDTARAVAAHLADGDGAFANLQAENDIAEPLVEGMLALADDGDAIGDDSARAWLVRNAEVASGARTSDGLYGRFWDGPPPVAPVTAWQTSGGLALAVAAAAVAPTHAVATDARWREARVTRVDLRLPITLAVDGAAIAVYGTLGERCCEAGHARVLVDGVPLADATGVWQDKSSSGRSFPDTVLFAWRWAAAGHHTIAFVASDTNVKEGGSHLHVTSYAVAP